MKRVRLFRNLGQFGNTRTRGHRWLGQTTFPQWMVPVPAGSALLGGYGKKRGDFLMNAFLATFRALEFALLVFRKAQDQLERLLAIFAVKLVTGHGYLRGIPEDGALTMGVRLSASDVKARLPRV
jgi:hypothetical protein